MARTGNLTDFLTDVAAAIKTKKGSQTNIPAANFDTEILNIPSQGIYQEKSLTINQNGNMTLLPDTGYDAMSRVSITTNVPTIEENVLDVTNDTVEVDGTTLIFGEELPYVELEYIQSSGTQYITLVSGSVNDTYGLKMKYSVVAEGDNYVAGSGSSLTGRIYFITAATQPRNDARIWTYGWGSTTTSTATPYYAMSTYPAGLENAYEAEMNYLNSKKIKFANNEAVEFSGNTQTFTNTNFYLFKSYSSAMTARIYYARLSVGNELFLDLIPVIRKSDNVICMYDKLSGLYYQNSGTGDFIAGPVKGGNE